MNAVSTVASVESKRASSAPPAASTIRTYRPLTRPKVPPSAEAATTMRSISRLDLPEVDGEGVGDTVARRPLALVTDGPGGVVGWL